MVSRCEMVGEVFAFAKVRLFASLVVKFCLFHLQSEVKFAYLIFHLRYGANFTFVRKLHSQRELHSPIGEFSSRGAMLPWAERPRSPPIAYSR